MQVGIEEFKRAFSLAAAEWMDEISVVAEPSDPTAREQFRRLVRKEDRRKLLRETDSAADARGGTKTRPDKPLPSRPSNPLAMSARP